MLYSWHRKGFTNVGLIGLATYNEHVCKSKGAREAELRPEKKREKKSGTNIMLRTHSRLPT